MTGDELPDIVMAEAYGDDICVVIRNERTATVVDWTGRTISEALHETADLPEFLDALAPLVAGAEIVVALGDSRTGLCTNWPRILKRNHLLGKSAVVVNFGGWTKHREDQFDLVEYFLDWLIDRSMLRPTIVYFGSWGDMLNKAIAYLEFQAGRAGSPVEAGEERLRLRDDLFSLLIDDAPGDWPAASRWIARRILAVARLFEQICAQAGAPFIAILEPNALPEYSPGYRRALLNARARDPEAEGMELAQWCRSRRYAESTANCGPIDVTPVFRHVQELWQLEATRSRRSGLWLDWSALFREVEENCFLEFDGLHYNAAGTGQIAAEMAKLLPISRGNHG